MLIFDIRHDNVMNIFLVMSRLKPNSCGDLSLLEPLQALSRLEDDIFSVNLPESITPRFDPHDDKVYWYVRLLCDVNILLHQTDDNLCLLVHCEPVLWVIEPLVICI